MRYELSEVIDAFGSALVVSIHLLQEDELADIRPRLNRIEGQINGIQQMVADGRDHLDILDQLAAVSSAANAVSSAVCAAVARWCLHHPDAFASSDAATQQIIRTVARSRR